MIALSDEFIVYDEVQYTKNDWRNRNLIKTPDGLQWITIPVGININRKISEVLIDNSWQENHLKRLRSNYARSIYFDEIIDFLMPIYFDGHLTTLSQLNCKFIIDISKYLGIDTLITSSANYTGCESKSKTQRLIDILRQTDATHYIAGPASRNYIDISMFEMNQIEIIWLDYDNYQEYPQLWSGFSHNVSIVDLLFNCGKMSRTYMRY